MNSARKEASLKILTEEKINPIKLGFLKLIKQQPEILKEVEISCGLKSTAYFFEAENFFLLLQKILTFYFVSHQQQPLQ